MGWNVLVAKNAEKSLKRIPKKDRQPLLSALSEITKDPFSGDIAKIAGEYNTWRRRVRNYRIIFEINAKQQTIYVVAIVRRTSTSY